jgi:hypothetical protein
MNGILSGLGQAAQQFFYKPQQTGQATAQNPSQALPMNIKSPVPMTPMTNQLNPAIKSPLANRQVAPHPIQPSIFDQTVQGAQHLGQNIAGLFNPSYASQGHNANTPWPSVQTAIQKANMGQRPNAQLANTHMATPTPAGQVLGVQVRGMSPTSAPASTSPNITIPYSQGGQYTLPSALAQVLMNSFNDVGQATNAAQVLNHPLDNPYRRGIDPQSVNHNTMGENGSFRTSNVDAPNSDGSIDRGLFRVNDRTFNGIMQHPVFSSLARQYGINSWQDMEDPQKNAYMARLILLNSNYNPQTQGFSSHPTWQRWFAAPHDLRSGAYQAGKPVQMHPKQ